MSQQNLPKAQLGINAVENTCVKIDDVVIGAGKPGTISNQLREAYITEALAEVS